MSDPWVRLALSLLDHRWPASLAGRQQLFEALAMREHDVMLDETLSYGLLETGVPGTRGLWQAYADELTSIELICEYGDGVAGIRKEVLEAFTERLGAPTRATFHGNGLRIWLSQVQDGTVTIQYSSAKRQQAAQPH